MNDKIHRVEVVLSNHNDPSRIARLVIESLKKAQITMPRWLGRLSHLPQDPRRTMEYVRR